MSHVLQNKIKTVDWAQDFHSQVREMSRERFLRTKTSRQSEDQHNLPAYAKQWSAEQNEGRMYLGDGWIRWTVRC